MTEIRMKIGQMFGLFLLTCTLFGRSFAGEENGPSIGVSGSFKGCEEKLDDGIKKARGVKEVPVRLFEQKLDHFNSSNVETWKQRYTERNKCYESKNLIFLMIEGEVEMNVTWVSSSFMAQEAEQFKAVMFQLEHRFYGGSKPTPDLTVASLQYLSSEQALADIAYFITQMNIKHNFTNPKWIVFGYSYPGTLAAWLRYKYPSLVYAAVASSAPLFAKVDLPEYYEAVATTLSAICPKCAEAVTDAFHMMGEEISNETARKNYKQLFNLCDDMSNDEKDIKSFLSDITLNVAGIVQGYNSTDSEGGLIKACNILTNETIGSPVHRYAEWCAGPVEKRKKCKNFNHYSNYIGRLNYTKYGNESSAERQWFYQKCTEFGWFQTTSKKDSTFGNKFMIQAADRINTCRDVFGPRFDAAFLNNVTKETNAKYKGYGIPVSRVVFVHGSLDPWSTVCMRKNPPKGSFIVRIEGESHVRDAYASSASDRPELQRAHGKISELLKTWIAEKEDQPRNQTAHQLKKDAIRKLPYFNFSKSVPLE